MALAARQAIADAGFRKEDIDGILVEAPRDERGRSFPPTFVEYLQIFPNLAGVFFKAS